VARGRCRAVEQLRLGPRRPIPYDVKDFRAPDVETVAPPLSQQKIGPLDRIRVTVFQVQDLSGEFTVDASGNIDYPLIGSVSAQGLTPPELSQRISQRLARRYLRNPSVQVSFLEQQQQTITVDGSVRQPGVREIRGETTLLRAVALGQGTTEDANLRRVLVFRTIEGQRMAAAFDLQSIRRGEAEDPKIYGNDVVVVDGPHARRVAGCAFGLAASWGIHPHPLIGRFSPVERTGEFTRIA
jgi:polysaccharide export outer membrane protein